MTLKCGIVDVGSNTMRLSIYQWEGEKFRLLIHKKEMAGLAGYIQDGTMSSEGIECACGVLKQFQEILKNLNVHDMYVFGTAPLRNITNTEAALDVIRSVTGLDVDVLSGAQEAHYSFVGATSCSDMRGSGLLTDIGGGSTELVSYENGVVTSECSLAIGSLSLHTTYVNGLFPTKAERKSIKERIRQELELMEFVHYIQNQKKKKNLPIINLVQIQVTVQEEEILQVEMEIQRQEEILQLETEIQQQEEILQAEMEIQQEEETLQNNEIKM